MTEYTSIFTPTTDFQSIVRSIRESFNSQKILPKQAILYTGLRELWLVYDALDLATKLDFLEKTDHISCICRDIMPIFITTKQVQYLPTSQQIIKIEVR